MSIYPDAIDGSAQLPVVIDKITSINADLINKIREAIINIEVELGIEPSGEFETVSDRLNTLAPSNLESILEDIELRISVLEQETIDHLDLLNIVWDVSGHTGTAGYLAGFNGLGNPVDIDPSSVGVTNHTALSNIAWATSGHTGTASYLAGWNGSNVAIAIDPSTVNAAAHASSHQNSGGDEISVTGLSGELADSQKVSVSRNSAAAVGSRSTINFIEGSNITLIVADDSIDNEVDVTITASVGSSSSGPFTLATAPPLVADFDPPINGGSSVITQGTGGSLIIEAAAGTTLQARLYPLVGTYTGAKTLRVCLTSTILDVAGTGAGFGIFLRRSANDRSVAYMHQAAAFSWIRWDAQTSATPTWSVSSYKSEPWWIEISDDGSNNIHGNFSADGSYWSTSSTIPDSAATETYAAFLGGKPDQMGIIGLSHNNYGVSSIGACHHLIVI
jgi:hypothetical protein